MANEKPKTHSYAEERREKDIREAARAMSKAIGDRDGSRSRALAHTKLHECVLWAVYGGKVDG